MLTVAQQPLEYLSISKQAIKSRGIIVFIQMDQNGTVKSWAVANLHPFRILPGRGLIINNIKQTLRGAR
jgi:hypothetical protein